MQISSPPMFLVKESETHLDHEHRNMVDHYVDSLESPTISMCLEGLRKLFPQFPEEPPNAITLELHSEMPEGPGDCAKLKIKAHTDPYSGHPYFSIVAQMTQHFVGMNIDSQDWVSGIMHFYEKLTRTGEVGVVVCWASWKVSNELPKMKEQPTWLL